MKRVVIDQEMIVLATIFFVLFNILFGIACYLLMIPAQAAGVAAAIIDTFAAIILIKSGTFHKTIRR